jgi:hypothetical protein
VDIFLGWLLNRYDLGITAEDIPEAVKHAKELIAKGYELETSSINALILILEKGIKTSRDLLNYEHDVIYRVYRSRTTKRTKARKLEELWEECISAITISDDQLARNIVRITIDVRNRIIENIDGILCVILKCSPSLENRLNKQIINTLKQSLKCDQRTLI